MVMPEDKDFFSITVLGHMNPMIHHPLWYLQSGLISEPESKEAIDSPNTYTLPPMSQFQTHALAIVCLANRWEVQTKTASNLGRIRRLAERLFDEILPHTPVSHYGFNFNFVRVTERAEVGLVLASRVARASIGLSEADATTAEITLRRALGDHSVSTAISQVAGNAVAVANNYEYPLPELTPENFVFFKLADKFAETFEADRQDAMSQTSAVVDAINEAPQ